MSVYLRKRDPIRAEINITSMLDIMMNILCVFILVAPIIQQGVDVNLPKASASELEQKDDSVTVSLQEVVQAGKKVGVIFVDQRQMAGANPFDELHTTLVNLRMQKPKISVIIRADKDFKYDAVIKVLDVVREAGITTLSLATQAE